MSFLINVDADAVLVDHLVKLLLALGVVEGVAEAVAASLLDADPQPDAVRHARRQLLHAPHRRGRQRERRAGRQQRPPLERADLRGGRRHARSACEHSVWMEDDVMMMESLHGDC